jgi:hypothetical protein
VLNHFHPHQRDSQRGGSKGNNYNSEQPTSQEGNRFYSFISFHRLFCHN